MLYWFFKNKFFIWVGKPNFKPQSVEKRGRLPQKRVWLGRAQRITRKGLISTSYLVQEKGKHRIYPK
jgi:hypothetical protein